MKHAGEGERVLQLGVLYYLLHKVITAACRVSAPAAFVHATQTLTWLFHRSSSKVFSSAAAQLPGVKNHILASLQINLHYLMPFFLF